MIGTWYEIEEEIPAEKAIGGKAYWTALNGSDGRTYQSGSVEAATEFYLLLDQGRKVRLIQVTREDVS